MERERMVWAFACWACMPDMTDEEVRYICDVNDDIFEMKDNTVNFKKQFLNEAKIENMAHMP